MPALAPPRRAAAVTALLVALGTAVAAGSDRHASADAGIVLEGYPTGTLQALVDLAMPGDHIQLHTGTYDGQVTINHSGAPGLPITIEPFGDGPVTVTATFPVEPCNNSKPAQNRTFYAAGGVDYWTIQGLNIVNGIWLSGSNFDVVAPWFKRREEVRDWQTRRALPGRGVNDPVAARNIYIALSTTLGVTVDPAEGWKILNNDMSGRGMHGTVTRDGELANNTIHDIACGIGPGAWLTTYSDFWKVHDNHVSTIAISTYRHYMQEGIRFGSASAYNVIENNLVSDLPGDGRGITTDIDASYNIFQHNTVTRTKMGFNDQQSGWENQWLSNTADAVRGPGFAFRGADAKLTRPSMNSTTYRSLVKCNRIINGGAMTAGALMETAFVSNYFKRISLSPNLKTYWTEYKNSWNGSTALPPAYPRQPTAGSCP